MNVKEIYPSLVLLIGMAVMGGRAGAQQSQSLNLQQATDAALQNNHLVNIKQLQVTEKKAKVEEDVIKRYPSVTLNSTYQYNVNLGELSIPEGSFGKLPLSSTTVIALPNQNLSFPLGDHNMFNAGVTLYQPITQQGKIKTGVAIDKTDVLIAEREKDKVVLQMTQAVEKIYYGLLINQKQQNEATAKLELAKIKLYDVESALMAGKTVEAGKAGLQANVADEEQNLVKLSIQAADYTADLKRLTGLPADSFYLEPVAMPAAGLVSVDQYKNSALSNNVDIRLAGLSQEKARLAIKAAHETYLPDVGFIAGYNYQKGTVLYPTHNPFAGINFKWNLQDMYANRQVIKQRNILLQQARENVVNTQEQVNTDIEKACRRLTQAQALIAVAQKAVHYRKEELKIQQDKQVAGLNKQADVLDAQALLARSEADLYAAQLSYRLALSDLRILSEGR